MQTEALGNLQPTITPTPTYENSRLTGLAIRKLMRKHGKTIRSLAGEYQLTLKRVREVREHGVHGFLASEWHFLITGKWLDGSTST
jgi:hypothetical protein